MTQETQLSFLTPSFFGDFEQCTLLCESLEKFVVEDYVHYLIVDRADCKLFRSLENSRTKVLSKEEVLPSWVSSWRFPLPQKNRYVRLSLKSRPIRGWIAQQMAKLSLCVQLKHEHVIMVDSDVFLTRRFEANALIENGLSPLFCNMGAIDPRTEPKHAMHEVWQRMSEKMLGSEVLDPPYPDFITPWNFWRPEVVRELKKRIELVTGKDWMVGVARAPSFCEPVTYGNFVLSEGPEACGHRLISDPLCYSYWTPKRISHLEMAEFLSKMPDHCYAVNIQSKANMPMDAYAHLVRGEKAKETGETVAP